VDCNCSSDLKINEMLRVAACPVTADCEIWFVVLLMDFWVICIKSKHYNWNVLFHVFVWSDTFLVNDYSDVLLGYQLGWVVDNPKELHCIYVLLLKHNFNKDKGKIVEASTLEPRSSRNTFKKTKYIQEYIPVSCMFLILWNTKFWSSWVWSWGTWKN